MCDSIEYVTNLLIYECRIKLLGCLMDDSAGSDHSIKDITKPRTLHSEPSLKQNLARYLLLLKAILGLVQDSKIKQQILNE